MNAITAPNISVNTIIRAHFSNRFAKHIFNPYHKFCRMKANSNQGMIPWEIPPEGRTGVGPSIKSSFIFDNFEFDSCFHFNFNFSS